MTNSKKYYCLFTKIIFVVIDNFIVTYYSKITILCEFDLSNIMLLYILVARGSKKKKTF